MITKQQRFQGALLGLATGDAIGTTVEFKQRGTFPLLTDMVGGGPFRLQPGQWTDDTSMALCLATSLVEKNGFDAADQMERYNNWRTTGYLSSNGRCFDIGVTVSEALSQYLRTNDPFSGSKNPFAAGNGSIMRLVPVVMFFYADIDKTLKFAIDSSRTTHGAKECLDACGYFASLLHCALSGMEKEQIFACNLYQANSRKVKAIQEQGYYRDQEMAQINSSGYVIDTLKAALWCFDKTNNFADAVLMAANLGDDADTTAAVCGQLAGAFYGVDAIPKHWREKLTQVDLLVELADKLLKQESS